MTKLRFKAVALASERKPLEVRNRRVKHRSITERKFSIAKQ
jgi:hypothetical protein